MTNTLADGDVFPLSSSRYGVAISWDTGRTAIDVDLQAVIIDEGGRVIEAVYYNNLKALKSFTHSGDEQTGEKEGFDETVWISLTKVPSSVRLVVFVVAAYQGGCLRNVKNGMIHVLENNASTEVARFAMEESEAQVDAVAMMVRSETNQWTLSVLDVDAQEGKHFIDILEPTIGSIVRGVIPTAPKRLKVAFAMEKGSVVDLPQSSSVQNIVAGLGWDVDDGEVDLDVAAVLFDGSGAQRESVFFGNLEAEGIKHSGDNLTGEGDGDDETINIHLESLPQWTQQIFLVVNIYTNGLSFAQVARPYCHIVDNAGNELARYELREAGSQNGLIIARLFREPGDRWGFQAIGSFCNGRTWKDTMHELTSVFHKTARQLQMRGASSMSLTGGQWAEAAQPAATQAAAASSFAPSTSSTPAKSKGACTLQ